MVTSEGDTTSPATNHQRTSQMHTTYYLIFALVIGAAAGWWLDQRFGWKPWGFFIGFGLGLAAGVRNVYQITRKYLK